VQTVAAFMMANVPAARLVAVAKTVGEMAPLLWGQYDPEQVQPTSFRVASISDRVERKLQDATESLHSHSGADDDSVAAMVRSG
jgi:hypothetical protein